MADTHDLTVSLLDDDPSVVKATSRLLSSAGWKVASFTDPIEFLSYARHLTHKSVVLDILMPRWMDLKCKNGSKVFLQPVR
jgi:FixJ family two-component response regulator